MKQDRYKIAVSTEPGCPGRFRWEIAPLGKSGSILASAYIFASRRAAIFDARFFLHKQGTTGIMDKPQVTSKELQSFQGLSE